MELTLVVRSGDATGKRFPVKSGAALCIGRQPPADVLLADDAKLSNQHFSVVCTGDRCSVKDLNSRFGTQLNGQKIQEATLRDGDEITAGQTLFGVVLEGDVRATPVGPSDAVTITPMPAPTPSGATIHLPILEVASPSKLTPVQQGVLAHLQQQEGLYAILDAAREAGIPSRLRASGAEHQSLYEGEKGEQIAQFGPWLVKLAAGQPLLEELVRDGWGNSWGVYLSCLRNSAELRRHLRQFLLAKLPDGRQVYFRYYDPRVLRTYLPTCNAEEVAKFVGPIVRYIAESADGKELLEFGANFRDWRKVEAAK